MANSGPKTPHPDTLACHGGPSPDPATGARAVPIYQTASYVFPDTDTAAALFNMETPGHVYSRLSNPTVAVLEERLAALEGGVGAIATADPTTCSPTPCPGSESTPPSCRPGTSRHGEARFVPRRGSSSGKASATP